MTNLIADRAAKDTAKLREFIDTFEASKDPELWKNLVTEELGEVEQALADLLKEFADLRYVITGLSLTAAPMELGEFLASLAPRMLRVLDLVEQEFCDLGDEAFDRVHTSNMSKLGEDGKPIRREDGKVLKGPNYAPPVLIDLITGTSNRTTRNALRPLYPDLSGNPRHEIPLGG